MMTIKERLPRLSAQARLGLGAAGLLAMGAAGGAGAVSVTRPAAVMAPTMATPVARLARGSGVVTVKGRVAEVYGQRFVVQDSTGRAMVDAGPDAAAVERGRPILVQGRFDGSELHAAYLVGSDGRVDPVGPAGLPRHGRGGPDRDGPTPPGAPGHDWATPGGPGAPPPPPPSSPGCATHGEAGTAPVSGRGAPVPARAG